jgi:hypothetical protein
VPTHILLYFSKKKTKKLYFFLNASTGFNQEETLQSGGSSQHQNPISASKLGVDTIKFFA